MWAEVLRSGTADAPPVTMAQAIGHTFRRPSAGGSSQGLLTAAATEGGAEPAVQADLMAPSPSVTARVASSPSPTTDGPQADGWQRLYLELYRGALRLAARPNAGYRGSEDRSRGVLPLFGQVSGGVGSGLAWYQGGYRASACWCCCYHLDGAVVPRLARDTGPPVSRDTPPFARW